MGLARLEGAAVLTALIDRVSTIELDGPPVRKRNNLIRSFGSLPVAVTTAVNGPAACDGAPSRRDAADDQW